MNVRKLRDVPRYRKTFIYRVDTWFELCFYRHRFLRPWRFIVLSHMYVHTSLFSSLYFFFSPISICSPIAHEYSYDFFLRVVVKYLAMRNLCAVKLARTTSPPFLLLIHSFFSSSFFFFFFDEICSVFCDTL